MQTLTVSGIDETTLGARTLHLLPSKIWELQHLRHLKLGDMYLIDPPNMVKEHLQTLVCTMPIRLRKKEVYYCRFPSIRKLRVVYKDVLVPSCSVGRCCRNPIIILENFENFLRLETLTVMVPVGSITLLEQVGFPANLEKLRLCGTNFPVKVLTVIGQLPKLKVLKLENAFYGRVWEVVEGGFPELQKLEVEARSLERWLVNTSNIFPKLKKIFLKRCYSLEEIPLVSAIKHRFWSIKLEQCPPSVVTSAKRFHEEMVLTIDGKAFGTLEEVSLLAYNCLLKSLRHVYGYTCWRHVALYVLSKLHAIVRASDLSQESHLGATTHSGAAPKVAHTLLALYPLIACTISKSSQHIFLSITAFVISEVNFSPE
nr:putative late blight resistance protein homolog R1A-4 isoform X1 [Ipomoea batatas]